MTATATEKGISQQQLDAWRQQIKAVLDGDETQERPWVTTRQLAALLAERERLREALRELMTGHSIKGEEQARAVLAEGGGK